ncbi:hypothetical protein [Bellilinea sp.]|jgi:hypothetical protein|uniref:hypothetical protein n=1 Tax=Bellilinea sp. TaxID=2838785 RepID=UPI002ADD4FC2|nr:hypothetical protein [Bellilinea sp.]
MSVEAFTRVWEHSRARGSRLVLLLALADQEGADGVAVINTPLLAEKCRKSEQWVKRTIRILEREEELIRRGNAVVILAGTNREDAERILQSRGVKYG